MSPSDIKSENGCYSVLQTDPYTGVPLTQSGKWSRSGEGYRYTFASLQEAEEFCTERLRGSPETEWYIFDSGGVCIGEFRDDTYWSSLKTPKLSFWKRLRIRLVGR
jgi:hypothetical protein